MPFWSIPITRNQLARVAASAVAIALAFCYVLRRYWAFYHLGVGAGFVFILLVPVAIIGSVIVTIALTFFLLRRRVPARRAIRLSVGGIAIVAFAVLASEILRSHDARYGEGVEAGDLAPFFRSLLAFR